jgi:hypothetical protein
MSGGIRPTTAISLFLIAWLCGFSLFPVAELRCSFDRPIFNQVAEMA